MRETGGAAVLKTDGSWGGREVAVAHDPAEATRAWRRLSRPPAWARIAKRLVVDRDPWPLRARVARRLPTISVQAFVHGRPGNVAAACVDGELLGAVQAEVVRSDGELGPSTVLRVIEHPEMRATATAMVRELGLTGLCGFDFVLEARHRPRPPARGQPAGHADVAPRRRRWRRPVDLAARRPRARRSTGADAVVPRRAGRPVPAGDAPRSRAARTSRPRTTTCPNRPSWSSTRCVTVAGDGPGRGRRVGAVRVAVSAVRVACSMQRSGSVNAWSLPNVATRSTTVIGAEAVAVASSVARASASALPTITSTGVAAATATSQHAADHLAVEVLRIEVALAGDHQVGLGHPVVEVDVVGNEVEPAEQAAAEGGQPAGQAARCATALEGADVDAELALRSGRRAGEAGP